MLVNVAEGGGGKPGEHSQSEREIAANENSRRFPRVVQPMETVISKMRPHGDRHGKALTRYPPRLRRHSI